MGKIGESLMEKNYVVYKHTCKSNGKVYIGITNNVERRWRCNGIEYKPSHDENQNRPFWNAICKYGWDNFEHAIIEKELSFEEACEQEKYYISLYEATDRDKGYNISSGGNGGLIYKEHPRGMLGKHHSEKKKQQQRELMKRLNEEGKVGNNWKNGHPRGMLGKHHSEEYKERLRNIPSGKHPSARKTAIKYSDGTIKVYECQKYLIEDLGVSNSTVIKIMKSGKPYEINPNCRSNLENLRKIEGATIYYVA